MKQEWQPEEGQLPPKLSPDRAVALTQTIRNRRDLDVIRPMVHYREKRVQNLGRRAAIETVLCILDEEIRRAKALASPAYRERRKK